MGPITHEAKSARETERGSRAAGDIGKVAVSRAKKRIRTIAETEGEGDMVNTKWRSVEGERKAVAAKSILETLGEDLAHEKNSVKEDTSTREGETISKKRLAIRNTNDKKQPKTHQRN